ncbi:Putative phosphoribosyltransferase [Septoria linicola]|uniref:Phosphoribosyltransferase n=1 Tax=Septoria linicola TaxID=215465 RepID=A0A9Q9EKH5_9PEZI|nr:Putative phosphoribosyltransferase [Septoria linicola]
MASKVKSELLVEAIAPQKIHQVLLSGDVQLLDISELTAASLGHLRLAAGTVRQLDLQSASSKTAAKVLMSATRDANVYGRALQEEHRKIGWYLTTEYVKELIGLEQFKRSHVHGGHTISHCLLGGARTSIIALIHGGEPMAFGVHDAIPEATFLHASEPADIRLHHIEGQETIILVDSVISGRKSITEHVNRIRSSGLPTRIVVVAGAVQEKAAQEQGLVKQLCGYGRFSVIALRTSANKYTGTRGTDTGNRLFNTIALD